jgi:hypothetical protein
VNRQSSVYHNTVEIRCSLVDISVGQPNQVLTLFVFLVW